MNQRLLMRTEMQSRNRSIAQAALEGLPVKAISRQSGLSKNRCYQLVHSVCSRLNPELYDSLRVSGQRLVPIATLREFAEAFLVPLDVDDSLVTRDTPIHRLTKLSTITLHALTNAEIKTVGDLMNCNVDYLNKIPLIGKVGILRIQESLQSIEIA